MYEKLISELRAHKCDALDEDPQEYCESCQYQVYVPDKRSITGVAFVCSYGQMRKAADAIERLETMLLAKPKKCGSWIELDDCMAICSECNSLGCTTKYCPNCGALMNVEIGDSDG